jgi:hypothetical protein
MISRPLLTRERSREGRRLREDGASIFEGEAEVQQNGGRKPGFYRGVHIMTRHSDRSLSIPGYIGCTAWSDDRSPDSGLSASLSGLGTDPTSAGIAAANPLPVR